MSKFLQVLRDLALLLARVGLGAIMIAHGWRRWQVDGIGKQVEYLEKFNTPYAEVAAWGGTLLELIGGIFLVVGALTPLVALGFVIHSGLVIAYTSWYRGIYVDQGGYEFTVVIGLLSLLFVVFGAGRVSIDSLFRRKKPHDADLDEDAPA